MISIVTGSARPGNVSEALAREVLRVCEGAGVEAQIINLRELDLPFVNSPLPPSSPDFTITDERVQRWHDAVVASDAMIFLTPTYNRQPSAVLKNAIDWLYAPWKDKPAAVIGYGWGEQKVSEPLMEALLEKVGAAVAAESIHLGFTADIALDGTLLDADGFDAAVRRMVKEINAFSDAKT